VNCPGPEDVYRTHRTRDEADRSRRSIWLGVMLAAVCVAWAVPAQGATCGPDAPTLARADIVFIGTLTSANAVGDRATFAVVEVWGAAELPAVVEVVGVPGRWAMPPPGTEALRYLVLAEVVSGGLRDTGDCAGRHPSMSTPWDPSLEFLRPATAHPPTNVKADASVPAQLLGAAGLILLVGLVSAIAFRRTRSPA
jgi:hypothetical protein